jgi:hypothetical protein
MHELVAKLTALDPDAGAAVQVIARFDALVEGRAGLEPILEAVAVLTRSPARLTAPGYRVDLRVAPDGRVQHDVGAPDPGWLSATLENGGPPAFWVERGGDYSLVDAMVLDRAAFAARELLHRTRGHAAADDPAAVETVLDARVGERDRIRAARLLHLPVDGVFRAVARPGSTGRIETVGGRTPSTLPPDDRLRTGRGRTGVGPAGPLAELPSSWARAKTALAFAAEGTEHDPGPNVVVAEELGLLALLPAGLDPAGPPPPDVRALEAAATAAPWVLGTLEAFTSHASLRLAAASLFLHHSTLQSRITTIEQDLGWQVRDPQGRLRVQLALAVRRFLLHP